MSLREGGDDTHADEMRVEEKKHRKTNRQEAHATQNGPRAIEVVANEVANDGVDGDAGIIDRN